MFIFKEIIKKSNYEEISIKSLTEGMILSKETISLFSKSKIKDLPRDTNENKTSSLNEIEVLAILKWEKSKYGKSTIEIVKKVPFSIYIYITYFVLFLYYYYRIILKGDI